MTEVVYSGWCLREPSKQTICSTRRILGRVDDATLFDWLRYYARVILLVGALGACLAGLVYMTNPRQYEAGTIMVSTGTSVPPRSFGSVAIVLSDSSVVLDSAGEKLGLTLPVRDFFRQYSEVISVPGSNVMLVVGRAEDADEARSISQAMSDALAEAFEERTDHQVRTFARPERTEVLEGFSLPVTLALGGTAGLFAGVALSVALYRRRRPVLSLLRAASILDAEQVAIYDPKGQAKLSRLRPRQALERVARNLRYRLEDPSETAQFARGGLQDPSERVVVAHVATPERELVLQGMAGAAASTSNRPKLLWIR